MRRRSGADMDHSGPRGFDTGEDMWKFRLSRDLRSLGVGRRSRDLPSRPRHTALAAMLCAGLDPDMNL
jgi:hypothetical protein